MCLPATAPSIRKPWPIMFYLWHLSLQKENGGVVMVNFYDAYINCYPINQTTPTLAQVAGRSCSHSSHSLWTAKSAEHINISCCMLFKYRFLLLSCLAQHVWFVSLANDIAYLRVCHLFFVRTCRYLRKPSYTRDYFIHYLFKVICFDKEKEHNLGQSSGVFFPVIWPRFLPTYSSFLPKFTYETFNPDKNPFPIVHTPECSPKLSWEVVRGLPYRMQSRSQATDIISTVFVYLLYHWWLLRNCAFLFKISVYIRYIGKHLPHS